jgi:hypothetical protein
MLALPIIWWHGFSMLVAVVPALASDITRGTVTLPARLRFLEGLIPSPELAGVSRRAAVRSIPAAR